MFDPSFCHHCNENKLDAKDKYFLPNGIEVCKQCAERHGSGTAKRQAACRSILKALPGVPYSCLLWCQDSLFCNTDFFRMICEKDFEGIVAKRRTSPYDASAKWIKIKNPVTPKRRTDTNF